MSFHLHLDTELILHVPIGTPIYVSPDVSTRDVLQQMKSGQQGSVLINDADFKLLGIFTERDSLQLTAASENLDAPISKYMSKAPVTIRSADTVSTAIKMMSKGGYRRLPVLDDDGKPVGIIKVSHILHYLVDHFPRVIYTLPPTPHQATQSREGA